MQNSHEKGVYFTILFNYNDSDLTSYKPILTYQATCYNKSFIFKSHKPDPYAKPKLCCIRNKANDGSHLHVHSKVLLEWKVNISVMQKQ